LDLRAWISRILSDNQHLAISTWQLANPKNQIPGTRKPKTRNPRTG
jgi:hypothetical protein